MTALISAILAALIAIGGFFAYQSQQESEISPQSIETNENTPPEASSLITVNRSGQNLTKMPSDILGMTNVQYLDLSNNRLTGAIPAEIRHLSKLEVLDLSDNAMTGLPAELGQLSRLRILRVSNNQLTGIPHELGNLQNLEVLDLSGNDISQQDLDIVRSRLPQSTKIQI
jgi:leucine-rich repeat protein SHOC2